MQTNRSESKLGKIISVLTGKHKMKAKHPDSKAGRILTVVLKVILALWCAFLASMLILLCMQLYSCSTDIGNVRSHPYAVWQGSNDTISRSDVTVGGKSYNLDSVFGDALNRYDNSSDGYHERPVFYHNGLFYKFVNGRFLWADLYRNGGVVSEQEYDADLVGWLPPYAYLAEKGRSRLAIYNVEQDRIVWRETFRPGASVQMTGGRCVWIFDHTLYVLEQSEDDWSARRVADVDARKPQELCGDILKMEVWRGRYESDYVSLSTGEPATEADFLAAAEERETQIAKSDGTYTFQVSSRAVTVRRTSDGQTRKLKFGKLAKKSSQFKYAANRKLKLNAVSVNGEIYFIAQYKKMWNGPHKAVFYYDYARDTVTYIADDRTPVTVIDPMTGSFGRIL